MWSSFLGATFTPKNQRSAFLLANVEWATNLEQGTEKLRMSTQAAAGGGKGGGSPLLLADSEQRLEKIPASADRPPVTQPTPPAQAQRTPD